jgi:hypothetical protein
MGGLLLPLKSTVYPSRQFIEKLVRRNKQPQSSSLSQVSRKDRATVDWTRLASIGSWQDENTKCDDAS